MHEVQEGKGVHCAKKREEAAAAEMVDKSQISDSDSS